MVKLNLANPSTGQQLVFSVENEKSLLPFHEKKMGDLVPGDSLAEVCGEGFAGSILKISGGNDKQGFPMKQGVLKNGRVRLLFKDGMSCYKERRGGMRKRKSVRGCIIGHDLAIINFVIVRTSPSGAEIPGLTDGSVSRRLGPKRASKIRSLFGLSKDDPVQKYAIRRETKEGSKGMRTKAPKIQRIVTAARVQRKRRVRKSITKKVESSRAGKAEYAHACAQHAHDVKEARHALLAKKKKAAA